MKKEIIEYICIFLMFLPMIISFKTVRIEFLQTTLTDTIINTLFGIILGGLVGVLFPQKPQKTNLTGAIIVIIVVIFTFTSFAVPSITIKFSGWINGELNSKTAVNFLYHNFHYWLWLYGLSFYLEHEVEGVSENE